MKHVEKILEDLDCSPPPPATIRYRDDTAEKLEALEEYKLRDDLQARPT